MSKIKGEHWRVNKETIRIQIKTSEQQARLEEALPDWQCVSYGYIPKTSQDIYVFEKTFESEIDWINFLKSEKITNLIEM